MPPDIKRSAIWPDPRVKPPQGAAEVNWSHPLAGGLLAFWPFNEGGGAAVDLCLGLPAIPAGGIAWRSSGAGLGGDFAASKYFAAAKPGIFQQAKSSMVTQARSESSNSQVIANVDFNGSNVPYHLSLDTGGTFPGYAFYDGNWRKSGMTTNVQNDKLDHFICGTYDGGTLSLYLDGVLDASAVYSGTQSLANTNTFDIGRYNAGAVPFVGVIYYLGLYSRALSASEAEWSKAEPFAMLQPIVRRRYFVPAAADNTFRSRIAGGRVIAA